MAIALFELVADAGQICASCTDIVGRDACHHYIECANEEVGATYFVSLVLILLY